MITGIERFDVLDRHLDINRNYFLEASAGTGKTFAIENIVVRLLLSEKPRSLSEILVVTFTRAATADLRLRIRENIDQILKSLKCRISPLDYVAAIIEQGDFAIQSAERKLKQAMLAYDQANIFTIHQFCFQMLSDFMFEGNAALEGSFHDNPLSSNYILTIIRDYFRTEVRSEVYSPQQLINLLKAYDHSMEKLEKALLKAITAGMDIAKTPSFSELLALFQEKMKSLTGEINGEKILSDFLKLAPNYQGFSRQINKESYEKVLRFCKLFDQTEWDIASFELLLEDNLYIAQALDPEKLLKKGKPINGPLYIPNLREWIREHFLQFVCPECTFAHMAHGCRHLLKTHLEEEELMGFDELIESASKAVENPDFINAVQGKFTCAIIDEFQDTDQNQWKIFRSLFTSQDWGNLYLVGDPKQSIYSFRQADIYTYIEAGNTLGDDYKATLDTNFRSHPPLIHGLNALFKRTAKFLPLPKINSFLDYQEVRCPESAKERLFSDTLGSIHFCIVEDLEAKKLSLEPIEKQYFHPFFAQEIQRLNQKEAIAYKDMAILISDRYEGQRIKESLAQWNIPSITQKSKSIVDTESYESMRHVLKGIISPNHESSFKAALGSRLIGWNHLEIRKLEDIEVFEGALTRFYTLRKVLFEEGFSSFIQQFLDHFHVRTRILEQEGGDEFYQDLQTIIELLLEEQARFSLTPGALLKFLDQIKITLEEDSTRLKRSKDPSEDAVTILTIHSSKGLEFDVIFTPGLLKEPKPPENFIPVNGVLTPILDASDPDYINYCNEMDAEKMRQFYVAMTRAKYRLYCPLVLTSKPSSSPMGLFLQKIGLDPFEFPGLSEAITVSRLKNATFEINKTVSKSIPEITLSKNFSPPGSPLYIHSFTSLSKHETKPSMGAPRDFQALEKNPHTLPSGSETGNLLHLILENFPHVSQEVIRPYVAFTPYLDWLPVIHEILVNVSKIDILSDINPEKCFRETEFLYPYDSHFLKGIVDLIFEHNNKFYIIDWKSNWLGPDHSFYNQENLHLAMKENDYLFQAELYKNALQKYLKIVDRREFDEIFGGSYYIFLRGLDGKTNAGVYKC